MSTSPRTSAGAVSAAPSSYIAAHRDLEATLYRRASATDRAAWDQAFHDYQSRRIDGDEMEHRQAAALGCTCNTRMDDEECNCPAYTLDTWAVAAIDGRTYRRRTGPDVRWAMRLPSGLILEIRPRYETIEQARAKWDSIPDQGPEPIPYLPPADSNWQPTMGYALAIYETADQRLPRHRGWYDGYGSALVTTGPQSVTDEVAAKLWQVYRDPGNAFAGMPWCGCCRRALTDEVSQRLGVGPECARQLGIPHGLTAARVKEVRQ